MFFFVGDDHISKTGQMIIEAHIDASETVYRETHPKTTAITTKLIDTTIDQAGIAGFRPMFAHVFFEEEISIHILANE